VEHSPPPAIPGCAILEQTGLGPCYEISQSSDSIICRKNINVKWQFLSSALLVFFSPFTIIMEANDAKSPVGQGTQPKIAKMFGNSKIQNSKRFCDDFLIEGKRQNPNRTGNPTK
jgi:hypothetical protein